MPTTQASAPGPVITNPYQSNAMPVFDIQLILLCAIACFIVGLALAERAILRTLFESIDDVLRLPSKSEAARVSGVQRSA